MKKIIILMVLFVFCSCSISDLPSLTIQAENINKSTEILKICESIDGFELYVSKEFRKEIKNKKADKLWIEFNGKKIEINLFNIFLSSNDNLMYQSPLTPYGYLSTFKHNDEIFIDLKVKDKNEFYNFIEKTVIEKCN